jgi:hypothetical protein
VKYLTTANFALIISVLLAILKFWEVIQNRLRIEAWHSSLYEDERICLANPTRNTVLIKYWNLVWVKKKFFIIIQKKEISTNYDTEEYRIRIEPCNYKEIQFNNEYQINWMPTEKNIDLCIELYVVGRKRPIRKTLSSF